MLLISCHGNLNSVLRVTYCFLATYGLAHDQLSWNVLLFSCNLIGQLCLSGPGYSSRPVNIHWKFFVRRDCALNQWLDQHMISRVFPLAYFRAWSINMLTSSFAEKCYIFLSKFPHCPHVLFTFTIIKFKKNYMKWNSPNSQVFPSTRWPCRVDASSCRTSSLLSSDSTVSSNISFDCLLSCVEK